MINCVDASVKFPHRLLETKHAWDEAWQQKDFREITRLIVVWLSSIGYVVCTTDAIYSATKTIFGWFGVVHHSVIQPISFMASILGAIGTLPVAVAPG